MMDTFAVLLVAASLATGQIRTSSVPDGLDRFTKHEIWLAAVNFRAKYHQEQALHHLCAGKLSVRTSTVNRALCVPAPAPAPQNIGSTHSTETVLLGVVAGVLVGGIVGLVLEPLVFGD